MFVAGTKFGTWLIKSIVYYTQFMLSNIIFLSGNIIVQPTSDEDSANDIVGKRENLLDNLLVLLNSATDLGVGPSIAELGPRLEDVSVMSSARGLENELVLVFFVLISPYVVACL